MFIWRMTTLIRSLLMLLALGSLAQLMTPTDAEARAGRRRSMGRSSNSSQQHAPASQPESNRYGQSQHAQPPMQNQRGGFMRSLAGGLAGGFIGSMLFSSLAQADDDDATGSGIGLFEIILMAGLAFLAYRFWKSRQKPALAYGTASAGGYQNTNYQKAAPITQPPQSAVGSSPTSEGYQPMMPEGISDDEALDVFFKVQGAWTRRDLAPIRQLLTSEVAEVFQKDLNELLSSRRINRLENISVRRTEVIKSWSEMDGLYSSVKISANMLDYSVDEQSGQVVDGSDSHPTKFEEVWVFSKESTSATWRLAGIDQV